MSFITVHESNAQHRVGNADCEEGWCGSYWPHPHDEDCDGLVHAARGDENGDGDYWIYELCDKCGEQP